MLMAAMLAMVLAAAAPAFAQDTTGSIVEECAAVLNQVNEGSQYAENTQTQDQAQYQYAPGGEGGEGDLVSDEFTEDVDIR